MSYKTGIASLAAALLLTAPLARADTDAPAQTAAPMAESSSGAPVRYPARGATMTQVHRLLGAPRQTLGPVGKPPITRWVYDGYTVYFEKRRVIDTVPEVPHP